MKYIKYIKEYFDTENIARNVRLNDVDIKKLVLDKSILSSTHMSRIDTQIKMTVPLLNSFDVTEYKGGLLYRNGYDYYIENGQSIFAIITIHIAINENNEYSVTYTSLIYYLINDEKITMFTDDYNDGGNIGENKILKGVGELVKFLNTTIIPMIYKTRDKFEELSNTDVANDLFKSNTSIKNN